MTVITSVSEFRDICLDLTQTTHGYVAIDTEFVREKTYWPQWSLLQLAIPEASYIIDVTTLDREDDFHAFKDLLRQDSIIKVFHACRQDMEIFFHELGIIPTTFFDCQTAAYLCGFPEGIGLAKLARELLDLQITKTQQYTNWLSRPLTDKQIAYATLDVEVIRQLYHALCGRLDELGRWGWLHYEQDYLRLPETYLPDANHLWKRIKTQHKMKAINRALLQELCRWREEKARSLNFNRGRVITDDAISKIIEFKTDNILDLAEHLPEIPIAHLEEIWDLLEAFQARPPHTFPRPKRPLHRPVYLPEAFEKIARLRQQVALKLQVSERLLANDEAVKDFISGNEANFMRGWRYEIFGAEAEKILKAYKVESYEIFAPASHTSDNL